MLSLLVAIANGAIVLVGIIFTNGLAVYTFSSNAIMNGVEQDVDKMTKGMNGLEKLAFAIFLGYIIFPLVLLVNAVKYSWPVVLGCSVAHAYCAITDPATYCTKMWTMGMMGIAVLAFLAIKIYQPKAFK